MNLQFQPVTPSQLPGRTVLNSARPGWRASGGLCDPDGMTERKPQGKTFGSWIDQQVSDAQDRGAFDNLPGAGKPLPDSHREFDGQAWALDWVRREGGSPEDCLPTPLRLRKEIERLTAGVPGLRSAQQVRDQAGELNQRILAWRRLPVDGPPIFVPLVDTDAMVRLWHEVSPHRAAQDSTGTTQASPGSAPASSEAAVSPGRRSRLRRRRPSAPSSK